MSGKWWRCGPVWLAVGLFGLAGCTSLRPATAESGRAATTTIGATPPSVAVAAPTSAMAGASGALSTRASRAILETLSKNGDETAIFERHLAIEEKITGTPLVVGNKTTLYQDGEATYAAMFKAIAAAKDHINIETYIIEDDEIGRKFSDALIEKQRMGVQVNFLYDSVGSLQTPKAFFQRLKDSGINTLEFNPVNPLNVKKGWELNQRDHRKLLILDGHSVFLGGVNISSVYSSGSAAQRAKKATAEPHTQWRDTHLLLEGPVVAEFQRMFLATWKKQKGEPLLEKNYFPKPVARGREVIRAIASSSDDGGGRMYQTLLSAIGSAETSIALTNAYFAPDENIMNALGSAVARGVQVRIILPAKTDSSLIFHAGRSFYAALLKSGVRVYERQQALLHAKTALIDGVWSTVGSSNLDWRSFLHNDEVNAVVLGTGFGEQMNAMFEKDLAASTEVTTATWQSRSWLQRVKEQAARVWVYWL
ncbi:MAG: cardiolipin synthase [Aeromicrobium sp.]|nr:cardiolipin synthase [Burkholderiales bacterium]